MNKFNLCAQGWLNIAIIILVISSSFMATSNVPLLKSTVIYSPSQLTNFYPILNVCVAFL